MIEKTEAEWRGSLTMEQYRVLREKGTEPANSGELCHEKREGTYHCAGCGQGLYPSDTKYDSGSGWPSFWQPVKDSALLEAEDVSLGVVRTELMCSLCGGHLGHIFTDGPEPTGERHCINSASLDFKPKE